MTKEMGFLWEDFIGENRTIDCRATAVVQVMEFNMQIVFEENLIEAGFEPEEAIEVFIADSELRMPPEAPKTTPEMAEVTIFLD